jgi:nucleoid DNA-binding protein
MLNAWSIARALYALLVEHKNMKKNGRRELLQALRNAGFTWRDAWLMTDTFTAWLYECLAAGEAVELRGLGSFGLQRIAERRTGIENMSSIIEAHSRVVFRPCEKLRKAVWGVKEDQGNAPRVEQKQNEEGKQGR